jgi:hypothetical protein
MKKGLLFTLCMVLGLGAFAQFTVWKDTVFYNGFPKDGTTKYKADTIYNSSSVDSVHFTWTKVSENLLTGWTGIGVCDWSNCQTWSGAGNLQTTGLAAGGKGIIYVDMSAASTAADGCSYTTLRISHIGSAYSKDIVYKYCNWPTSVKDADPANFVTIYPNPASSFINISINNDKITTLNVLNVVGRKVAKFDVTPNTPNPIRIGLDNVADGVYLLQFTDAAGKQLGVKRVTKN